MGGSKKQKSSGINESHEVKDFDDALLRIEQQIEILRQQKKQLLLAKNRVSIEENAIEQMQDYSCSKASNRKVVVIGGRGKLGKVFVQLFSHSGYQTEIVESEDWKDSDCKFKDACLVLVSVPINVTHKVIQYLPQLPQDCVLADVTSIKEKPLQAMLNQHQGAVVGLHPMFGPDVNHINKQTIVVCHGRQQSGYTWLLQQFAVWGARLHEVSAEQHDQSMAFVQVLRHFSTVVYGAHLASENIDLDNIMAMSSPIYRLELAMVGRLFAQEPDLYTEIIFANPQNLEMMRRFKLQFESLLFLLASDNKTEFKKVFKKTSDWFGDYADEFMRESNQMLSATVNAS